MRNWISGAEVIEAVADGGTMDGPDDEYRVTWHSTENDPYTTRASAIAHYLNQTRNCVHVLWNPVFGEVVVGLTQGKAGRGLENHDGGVETNRRGKRHIQVEVVGRASDPFTDGPMVNKEAILTALDELGVPRKAPSGDPLPYPKSYGDHAGRTAAMKGSGHYTHSQWEENVHGDPGAIDWTALLGKKSKPKPDPRPPNPEPQWERENGDGLYERGEYGPGIKTLQEALRQAGFYTAAVDGYYGQVTEATVRLFQQAHGLHPVDGIAGPKVLHRLGFDHAIPHGPGLKVDGVMGRRTMRALQHAVGLRGEAVDGWFRKIGPYTYNLGEETTRRIRLHIGASSTIHIVRAMQMYLDDQGYPLEIDGAMGHDTIVALQRALNKGRF
jgi:peptidoglycan hydrolase-like protein with peptidoglycan-binding domain